MCSWTLLLSLWISSRRGNECWDLTTQSRSERRTLNHLLECISRNFSLEQTIEAGKDEGILGIDKTVIKAGLLTRTKNLYKVHERLLVLVPGKLFLFKGPDISSRRVQYVTTLARSRVEATHGQPSLQILVPNTKALSLAASSVEAAKEWISALDDSIEYANRQGAVNRSKQAVARKSKGHTQHYDGSHVSPHSHRLQTLQLADRMAVSANPFRMAGANTQEYYSQPAADQLDGITQQMYMDNGSDNRPHKDTESYNDMPSQESTNFSEYRMENPRLCRKDFATNQASTQHYNGRSQISGLHHDRVPFPKSIGSLHAGGSSNVYAAPNIASYRFFSSSDVYGRGATSLRGTRGDYFLQKGWPYSEPFYQGTRIDVESPSNCQQQIPNANIPNKEYPSMSAQFARSRNLHSDHPRLFDRPLDGMLPLIFHDSPTRGSPMPS